MVKYENKRRKREMENRKGTVEDEGGESEGGWGRK
jgi:hypothetical protein